MAFQPGTPCARAALAALGLAALVSSGALAEAPEIDGHVVPERAEVEHLLGVYTAGRERLELRFDGGLVLVLDRLPVPVDGRWHETVPTFAVRHRAAWLAARGVLTLEEQHDEGAHWRYELRFEDGRLDKVAPASPDSGGETVVRSYRRRPGSPDSPTPRC